MFELINYVTENDLFWGKIRLVQAKSDNYYTYLQNFRKNQTTKVQLL